jgi:hypothetical protein
MLDNLNLQDIFSTAVKASEATVAANKEVFTTEVLTELAKLSVVQYNAIENLISKIITTRMSTAEDTRDYATAISTLRDVSLTYLPKV